MRAFKPPLQAVKTTRQRREQEALQAYAAALMARARAIERLQFAEHALAGAQADWQSKASRGCDAEQMTQYSAHCDSLARSRNEMARLLTEAEKHAEARLSELLLARQQREAVEKFQSRQRALYDKAVSAEEQKIMDELAARAPLAAIRSNSSNANLC